MRDIKFRAWDKREGLNKMYYGVSFIAYGEGLTGGNPEYKFWQIYHEQGGFFISSMIELELMQFTGLQDKKGKDIYEGDIYHNGDNKITYTVIWRNSGFMGKQNSSSSFVGLDYWIENTEVIGNIYEHPNLLNNE